MPRKPSMGRRKVEMKKIDNEASRLVTFSKRRVGLFKKASELCTLCGAEVAILVFSQNGKVYSFGHPCVDSILDKFLIQNILPEEDVPQIIRNNIIQGTRVHELNQEITQLRSQLEEEKKRGETLRQPEEEIQGRAWWQEPTKNLDLPELKHVMLSMGELKKHAIMQANMITGRVPITSSFSATSSTQAADDPFVARSAANDTAAVSHGYGFERGHF